MIIGIMILIGIADDNNCDEDAAQQNHCHF